MTTDRLLSLSSLPVEVLRQICSYLCSHCTGASCADEQLLGKALESLCLTSHRWRSIAQPVLFHHIQGNRLYNVIQTLDQRPDLAACVRKFTQASLFRFFVESADEPDFSFIRNLARKLLLDGDTEALNDTPWDEVLLIQILIVLAPNMETLKLCIDNSFHEITSFDDLSKRFKRLPAAGLPNLRHVQFGTDWRWGFHLSSPAVGVILQGSPNLEQLIFKCCKVQADNAKSLASTVAKYPRLHYLRTLEFQNCAIGDDDGCFFFLAELLKKCNRLEHFRIRSQKMYVSVEIHDHLPAPRLLEALKPHRKSLKSLDIDLFEALADNMRHPDEFNTFINPEILSQFTSLETLKLGDESFCLHRRYPHPPLPSVTSPSCLTSLIPQSVKTLVLRIFILSNAWEDLAELAAQAQAGRFPNLRCINAYAVPELNGEKREYVDQLIETYEKTHISFSVKEQRDTSNEGEDETGWIM